MLFMQDELSALSRLGFQNFSELIEKGVRPDGHPAFVQTFLYLWTGIFGMEEWVVKLPFLLCGLASILLVYKISERLFNEKSAQFAAAMVAFSQYYVLYFSIARPYALGSFFILAQLYALILMKDQHGWKLPVIFMLFTLLSAMTHYFSLMCSGIIVIWAFFWLPKVQWKPMILAVLGSLLLFIPHIGISMDQLSKGGIGGPDGWLAAPEDDFLWEYIRYLGQYSWMGIGFILLSSLMVFRYFSMMNQEQRQFLVLGLGTLLIPFIIGYYYSIYYSPVLQFSLLIFGSLPFVIALNSGWSFMPARWKNPLLIALMISCCYGLFIERNHKQMMSHQSFDSISKLTKELNGEAERPLILSFMNEGFLKIYAEKEDLEYDLLQIDTLVMEDVYKALLKHGPPILFNSNQSLEILPMLMDEYPSEHCLFQFKTFELIEISKRSAISNCPDPLIKSIQGNPFELDSLTEWSPSLEFNLDDFSDFPFVTLHISALIHSDMRPMGTMVAEIWQADSLISWNGRDLSKYGVIKEDGSHAYMSFRIQDILKEQQQVRGLKLKIYYWNSGFNKLNSKGIMLKVFPDSPERYSLFKEIPKKS